MVKNNNANAKNLKWRVVCHNCGKISEILNPNCSEVVWRLDVKKSIKEEILKSLEDNDEEEEENIYTDDNYPNFCLDDMLKQMEGAINVDEVEFVLEDSQAREGIEEYTRECFEIAKKVKKKEITMDEAIKLTEKSWKVEVEENEDDEDY